MVLCHTAEWSYICVITDPAKAINCKRMKKFLSHDQISVVVILSPRLLNTHGKIFASTVTKIIMPLWNEEEYERLFKKMPWKQFDNVHEDLTEMLLRQDTEPDDMFRALNRQWFNKQLRPKAEEILKKDWSELVANDSENIGPILKKVIEYRRIAFEGSLRLILEGNVVENIKSTFADKEISDPLAMDFFEMTSNSLKGTEWLNSSSFAPLTEFLRNIVHIRKIAHNILQKATKVNRETNYFKKGWDYEELFHTCFEMANSVDFQIDDGKKLTFKKMLTRCQFSEVEKIDIESDRYYVPIDNTFPVIDSFLFTQQNLQTLKKGKKMLLFQMTTSHKKKMDNKNLKALVLNLKNKVNKDVTWYFVYFVVAKKFTCAAQYSVPIDENETLVLHIKVLRLGDSVEPRI